MRKFAHSLQGLVLALALCVSATQLPGQVVIYSPHLVGDPGENVKVEIKVSDFEDMVSCQFSLQYDSTILSYVSVGDFGIINISLSNNFGVPAGSFPTPKGAITFLWIADNIITGQTLTDSSTLFSVTFKIMGTAGQKSPIAFSSVPTPLEFGNLNGEMEYMAFDGMVTVSGGTSAEEVVTRDFTFFPLSPNPARDRAHAQFYLRKTSQVTISIFDISGHLISQETHTLGSGMHALPLPAARFPVPGQYLVRLTTENAQAVQQLIVVP